jgi:hypothetical protein
MKFDEYASSFEHAVKEFRNEGGKLIAHHGMRTFVYHN